MQSVYLTIRSMLLAIGLLAVVASSSLADDFRVTNAFLKADDARMSGPCPLRVVFNGDITTNGPGIVRYTFTRSDGATGPVFTMAFRTAGRQRVNTDWTLGDDGALPNFAGWQAIRILYPNEMESNHETGSFSISCREETDDFRVTNAFLKADDARMSGPCPLRVVFNGDITTNGPGIVRYTFTRSDGATGPVFTMAFRTAGRQRVNTDWTLGDDGALPNFAGWQAIRILYPNEMESNHETGSFSISCREEADDFRVTNAFLKADDARMSGPCPLRVVFNGDITTNGPGIVRYTLTRSDGATGPVFTMAFGTAGRQRVNTDWTLGDDRALPHFAGWQAIRILYPNEMESNHETGSFS